MANVSIEPALRRTTWIVLAALMLVFGLGISHRSHFVVCTGQCCRCDEAKPVRRDHCASCCCRVHTTGKRAQPRVATSSATSGRQPGPGQRRTCEPGCCVDLVFDVELAPALRAAAEHVAHASATEIAEVRLDAPTRGWPQREWPHDTGPPRTDRRTALRACTVLLL